MYIYRTLENVSNVLLFDTFLEAFEGFPIVSEADVKDFYDLLKKNAYDPEISIGAFHAVTHELVAFVLNCIREDGNEKSAYIILTGTKPSYRRQGIMSHIFKETTDVLRRKKAARYFTEVLVNNTLALQFYQTQGFVIMNEAATIVSTKAGDKQVHQYTVSMDL